MGESNLLALFAQAKFPALRMRLTLSADFKTAAQQGSKKSPKYIAKEITCYLKTFQSGEINIGTANQLLQSYVQNLIKTG